MSKGMRLLQDNALAHKSGVAISKVVSCGFELLPHPPYSPDLAPSDYHLFPDMKKQLCGLVFADNEETTAAVLNVLEGFETPFFKEGLKALEKRCEKCVRLNGYYVEK